MENKIHIKYREIGTIVLTGYGISAPVSKDLAFITSNSYYIEICNNLRTIPDGYRYKFKFYNALKVYCNNFFSLEFLSDEIDVYRNGDEGILINTFVGSFD